MINFALRFVDSRNLVQNVIITAYIDVLFYHLFVNYLRLSHRRWFDLWVINLAIVISRSSIKWEAILGKVNPFLLIDR